VVFAGLVDAEDCPEFDEVDAIPIDGGITPGGIIPLGIPGGIPPGIPPRTGGPEGAEDAEEDCEVEELSDPPPLHPAIRSVIPKAKAKEPHFISCLLSFRKGILRNAILKLDRWS